MKNDCVAMGCGAGIGKPYIMCREHWYKVPLHLRRILTRFHDAKDFSSVAAHVAKQLAVREVGLVEGTFSIDETRRQAEIARWTAERDKLLAALGELYLVEVVPFRERLKKLLDDCGGADPLEVAALAIKFDAVRDEHHNARRVAAAVDVYEHAMGKDTA